MRPDAPYVLGAILLAYLMLQVWITTCRIVVQRTLRRRAESATYISEP